VLLRAAKRNDSITLRASAHHLLADVWTSLGVLVGVGAAVATGWLVLDPLVALLVAANIVWTGYRILRDSVSGLMDEALPARELPRSGRCWTVTSRSASSTTRSAPAGRPAPLLLGARARARRLDRAAGSSAARAARGGAARRVPSISVFTHLESLDDPASWADMEIDRPAATRDGTGSS